MIFLTNYKIIYVFRSPTDRLRVFTIWWSTGISEEEQRPFRQLQHRREKTRIQTHSQGSLIFRMDDSWWNALFGHNEGYLTVYKVLCLTPSNSKLKHSMQYTRHDFWNFNTCCQTSSFLKHPWYVVAQLNTWSLFLSVLNIRKPSTKPKMLWNFLGCMFQFSDNKGDILSELFYFWAAWELKKSIAIQLNN